MQKIPDLDVFIGFYNYGACNTSNVNHLTSNLILTISNALRFR